jgi:cytochrome c biogenesis protein
VIRKVLRKTLSVLASAWLAVGTLTFVGLWAMVATAVPQGAAGTFGVAAWAKAHPALEPVVNVLGLHQAFTAGLFLVCVALLGISTVVCSWRRTKTAYLRARTLRAAARADAASIAGEHELAIVLAPDAAPAETLPVAQEALAQLGVRTKLGTGVLSAVSPWWSVWGSAVFHWALVALMLFVLVGTLQRSDGLMAVSVGQTKPDAPASYGELVTGPLHSWSGVDRSFRVDALDPDLKLGGVDRGAVPTVSVLDATGKVVKTQLVYPNMMLHEGTVAINCPAVGLSADIGLESTGGVEIARSYEPIDFSQTATEGTVPVGLLGIFDNSGAVEMRIAVTVPLDKRNGQFGEWIPSVPRAHIVVYAADGATLVDTVIKPGETAELPGGGSLKLLGIGWYARLSIVDDWSTPFIYTAMIIALLGLSISLLARQQIVLAAVVDGPDGPALALRMRLWRNVPTTRADIETVLTEALGGGTDVPASDDKEIGS